MFRLIGKTVLSLLFLIFTFSGTAFAKLNMPHFYSYGDCVSGKCKKGAGRIKSKIYPIAYEGYFDRNGQPTTGNYVAEYNGKRYPTTYENGRPIEGAKFYTNPVGSTVDVFVGKFNRYQDPYAEVGVAVPGEGVYTDSNGFSYTGTFFAFPAMGMNKQTYLKYAKARRQPEANIVFIGTISFKGQSEVGIYLKENYIVSTQMRGFVPTDETALKGLERRFNDEYQSRQRVLNKYAEKKSRSRKMWGQVFALTAGAVMVNNSSMSEDKKAEFIKAYASDVVNGTTTNLSRLQKSAASGKTANQIMKEHQKFLRDYAQEQQAKKASKPQLASAAQSQRQVVNQQPYAGTTRTSVPTAKVLEKRSQYRAGYNSNRSSSSSTSSHSSGYRQSGSSSASSSMQASYQSGSSSNNKKEPKEKGPCIGRTESNNPLPSGKCGLVYADYSRTLHFEYEDYEKEGGAFMNEGGSREGAERSLRNVMQNRARKMCKQEGYSEVFLPNDYSQRGIESTVKDCKDYKRMGTTFYLCRGSSEFTCARREDR